MKTLISSFLESLELTQTQVHNFPSKIFLCGGPKESAKDREWASARHYISDYLQKNHPDINKDIILAEVHADWRSGKHYKTLLDVEVDIVNLASVIIIFLESAGSIAELGAFAMLKNVKTRIHLFMQQEHSEKRSFICDGLAAYIDDSEPQTRIYAYDWRIKDNKLDNPEEFSKYIADIVSNISAASRLKRTAIKIDFNDTGHQMLFLINMIYIFGAVVLSECIHFMDVVCRLKKEEVINRLYALERLNLVKKIKYGSNTYYMLVDNTHYCNFYSKSTNKQIDITGKMIIMREKILKLDDKRYGVISKFAAR